ncbi:MAG: protein kinase, partial [Planctomycetota bacterium]
MPGSVSDEAFARGVQQMGVVSYEQLEAAKAAQAQSAAKGVLVSLADMLVQQGVITAATRENIEKKLQAQQAGGIQKLGNYKLIKKLGEGGMGAVYLAEDTLMNRKVALKILPKKHAGDSEFLSRFRREAQATAQLNHANIVNAYTVGEELGHHFIVMEYCEGESLEALLKREHFVQWDLATGLVLQVARGLQHAHERGIIHRDIKPANIMLCNPVAQPSGLRRNPEDCATFAEGFVVKILDLGLSKNVGAGEQSFNTQTGVALGTPHYISPEQANGDKNIDGRTDIYSLGATFYHLVTGETPFQASTAMAIMMKHINEQLPNPQDIRDEIPDGVVQVIQRMMAKAPADRYRDCKELLDDLELVIDGKMPSSQAIDVGKSSVAVAKVPRASRPPGAPASRRPLARAGAGARPPVLTPLADARGSESPGAARQSVGRVANPPHPPGDLANRPTTKYIAIGALGVGALILVLALFFGGGGDKPGNQAASTASTPSIPSISSTPSIADTEAAAKLKAEAARLEEKRKADEAKLEEEKRKLAEGLRKLEEARLAAEAEAKKKAEAPATKVTPPPVQPDTKTTQPDTKASETPALPNAAETRAAKAQQLFSTVLKETGPLLIQNKLSDAIALLERKAKDPVLADAAELVKQEKSDVESVLALRQAAIEALRLPLGKQIALKKGGTLFKGKVVNEPKADAVTFDMGDRAQMTFTSTMLSLEDVDQYAPRTGNVGADLRQRGIMYLAAGNVAMAKEYFSKPQTLNPEPYLDRITQMELGEIEAAALKSWERAEKLFAAKDMRGAKAAYETFEREHGQTATAKAGAATVRERYDAIEKVIGPAPTLSLDLGGGVKMGMLLIKAGEFMMGADNEG